MKCTLRIFCLVAVICSGCKESTPASGPSGFLGDLKGKIAVYDTNSTLLPDQSGVLVQADGTPYSTLTDSTGYWTLRDIPTRTYSLRYSKPGFATMRRMSVVFVGGSTEYVGYDEINQLVNYDVTLDSLSLTHPSDDPSSTSFALVSFHFSSMPSRTAGRSGVFTFGLSPNSDCNDPSTYILRLEGDLGRENPYNWYQVGLSQSSIDSLPRGTPIYVRAFPVGRFGQYDQFGGTYFDIDRQLTIYDNVGKPSNTLTMVIP